ncbi:hypothetical protein J2T57_001489 [Natronocella acetinitrilica]|uniref:Uncharacterized protein n=1 Tax=Natronocella acetinitrilica TaxID=414046 RepID=A0AAE3G2T5_9GAMM|nr:hypothetical protein [Natronocella acetinitrilica]MCP1674387.1 hypothetical protein [Natronocella acetinitrilica]
MHDDNPQQSAEHLRACLVESLTRAMVAELRASGEQLYAFAREGFAGCDNLDAAELVEMLFDRGLHRTTTDPVLRKALGPQRGPRLSVSTEDAMRERLLLALGDPDTLEDARHRVISALDFDSRYVVLDHAGGFGAGAAESTFIGSLRLQCRRDGRRLTAQLDAAFVPGSASLQSLRAVEIDERGRHLGPIESPEWHPGNGAPPRGTTSHRRQPPGGDPEP